MTTQVTLIGKRYKVFHEGWPLHFAMPLILNTPANEIPIHFFCPPITQREILLVNVLTDPVLYDRIIASALYQNDPIFPQAITLF